MGKELMHLVVVGHVDHGKSTVMGRLLADTDSLPEGKLANVKAYCERNAKPFEYAYLLDALKDEQQQGITIDAARVFFSTDTRDYIILDAPGHIEFLKNMVTGAAKAESAVLVIDAKEGVRENSKRHGYLLSMLGVRQVTVVVNKMDLVDYRQDVFEAIQREYTQFLTEIGVTPQYVLPLSAMEGTNIVERSDRLTWFTGPTLLEALDAFSKDPPLIDKPFRMPLQDIYRFSETGDERRLYAGRIESGRLAAGDSVVFYPSGKRSTIARLEGFPQAPSSCMVGESCGFTLSEQVYVRRGELLCKEGEPTPLTSSQLHGRLFWMGRSPLVQGKDYILKLGTQRVFARLDTVVSVLDASTMHLTQKEQVDRHDVAECIFSLAKPISYDLHADHPALGRFVLVDGYDVCGGGIITQRAQDAYSSVRHQVHEREKTWYGSSITHQERAMMYGQKPSLIFITGKSGVDKQSVAKAVERRLFQIGRKPYFFLIGNLLRGLDADIGKEARKEHIRRFGEVAHILMDAGLIVIATASDFSDEELGFLQTILNEDFHVVSMGNHVSSQLDLSTEASVDENTHKLMEYLRTQQIIFSL